MPKLTPAERGLIVRIKNHLKTVEYKSSSATYIHNLLHIIERLTSEKDSSGVEGQ